MSESRGRSEPARRGRGRRRVGADPRQFKAGIDSPARASAQQTVTEPGDLDDIEHAYRELLAETQAARSI
jgi:hypothetical protein